MAAQQEFHPQSGSFYMINHFKIQPWMLEHLKHVRVVKVVEDPTDTTVVAAEYASLVSVESYFGVRGNSSTWQDEFEMIDPEILDRKEDGFPTRALYRRISHQEFSDRKYSADFWIIPPCYVEPPIHVGSYYTIDRTALPPVSFHSVDELRTAKVVKVLETTDSTVWIGYSNEQSVNQFLKLYQIVKSIPDLMGNPVINRQQELLITTAERLLDERLRPNWVERRGDRTFWLVEEEDYGLDFGSPFGSPQRVFADQPPLPIGAPDSKWIPGRFYRIHYAKLPENLILSFKQTAIVIVHDADRRMVRVRFPNAETVKKYLDASPRPELPTLSHLVSLPQNVAERFLEVVGEDEVQAMKGSREFWLASKWIHGRFYRLNYAELPEGLISLFKKTAVVMVHDADVYDADKCEMVRMRFPDADAVNKYLDAYPRAELPTLKHLVCLPQSKVERFVEEVGDDEVEARKGSREFWLGVEAPLEEDEGAARGGDSGGQSRGGARRGWSHSLGLLEAPLEEDEGAARGGDSGGQSRGGARRGWSHSLGLRNRW